MYEYLVSIPESTHRALYSLTECTGFEPVLPFGTGSLANCSLHHLSNTPKYLSFTDSHVRLMYRKLFITLSLIDCWNQISIMPMTGLEPARFRHVFLRHTCLPIPPHGLIPVRCAFTPKNP